MDCLLNCVARNWAIIALAGLLGLAVGVVGSAFIACLLAEGIIQITTGGGLIWIGGTVTLACMFGMLLTPGPWIVGAVLALLFVIVAAAWVLADCSSGCAIETQAAGSQGTRQGLIGEDNPFGDGPIDCAKATTALERARRDLEAAKEERDRREQELQNRENAARTARNLMVGAAAALAAAPFWDILAIAAAAVALASATALWLARQARVAASRAALVAAQAAVNVMQGALDLAEAAVEAACGKKPERPGTDPIEIPRAPRLGNG